MKGPPPSKHSKLVRMLRQLVLGIAVKLNHVIGALHAPSC
jgi:hypothetical protein